MYKVVYLDSVEHDLRHLDKPAARRIISKIEKHLAKDPKNLGSPLKGQFDGLWRYRISDYRVIYRIADNEILIIIARIGHRKNIYNG